MEKIFSAKTLNTFFGAVVLLALLFVPGTTMAQSGETGANSTSEALAIAPGAIPIQGRLTNKQGLPLNGTYSMTFRLYDTVDALIAICADVREVVVTNGLFSDVIDHCYNGKLNGQKVWLGIQVGADAEMTPRQVIYPVPYALGLVPGAQIESSTAATTPLTVNTSSSTGKALVAGSTAGSGENYAIYASGASSTATSATGFFTNTGSGSAVRASGWGGDGVTASSLGVAVRASSVGDAALALEGTGRLTSTAKSYIWISGNSVRPFHSTDTTIFDNDVYGGVYIKKGADTGTKYISVPVTIPGDLYGQDVKLVGLDYYFVTQSTFDGVSAILMRVQKGVCESTSCYGVILDDRTDKICDDAEFATGCTIHYDLTTNNVISQANGIIYLTLELAFDGGPNNWVHIGGFRLTLEHK